MGLYLTVDANASAQFEITATGRDHQICADVENSLILSTYRDVLAGARCEPVPLFLRISNEIPLGMGCGSSAAALLAGVMLADHFGRLGWSGQQILEEACRREGHPDNVAACWRGGMTCSASVEGAIMTATCGLDLPWRLLLAVPSASLATEKARSLLPASYSRADAVANVQNVALLVAAFSQGRGDLLRYAMKDYLHQPYRMEACPLLPLLLPLSTEQGVLGVALSGAGPSVLVIAESEESVPSITGRIRDRSEEPSLEVIHTFIANGAAKSMILGG